MANLIILPKNTARTPAKTPAKGNLSIHTGFRSRMEIHRHAKERNARVVSHDVLHSGIMGKNALTAAEKLPATAENTPVCAREIIAYAGKGRSFSEYIDIIDSQTGTMVPLNFLRGMDLPGKGEKGRKPAAMLVITPQYFDTFNGGPQIVVVPQSAIVLEEKNGTLVPRDNLEVSGEGPARPQKEEEFLMQVQYEGDARPNGRIQVFHLLPHLSVRTLSRTFDARMDVFATLPFRHNYSAVLEETPKEPAKDAPGAGRQ
jgi:hypothetical protein